MSVIGGHLRERQVPCSAYTQLVRFCDLLSYCCWCCLPVSWLAP